MAERLRVDIDARNRTGGAFREVGRGLQDMDRKVAVLSRGFTGLAAAGGVLTLATTVKKATAALAELADTADRIGLTTDALQELQFAAVKSGVDIGTMEMGMQRFTRRLAEAQQGTGEMKGVLDQYGIAVRNADGTTRSQAEVLGDLAEAIKNAESDQEALRIAFKAFDSEGAVMVNVLRLGRDALLAMMDEAHRFGAVIDGEAIQAARRFDTQLNVLWHTIKVNGKAAIAEGVESIGDLIEALGNIPDRASDLFSEEAKAAARLASQVQVLDRLERDRVKFLERGATAIVREIDERIARLRVEMAAGPSPERPALPTVTVTPSGPTVPAPTRRPTDLIIAEDRDAALQGIKDAERATQRLAQERERAAQAAEREAERVRQLIEDLQFEAELLGRSEGEQRAMVEIRRAGAEATEEQREAIGRLVEQIQQEEDRLERQRENREKAEEEIERRADDLERANDRLTQSYEQLGTRGLSVLAGLALKTTDWKQAVVSLIPLLGDVALRLLDVGEAQRALDSLGGGGGGGGGILGSLFGSGGGGGGGILGSIGSIFTGGFGGGAGAGGSSFAFPAIFHDGGVAGGPAPRRMPGADGRIRMSGDEVPAILQRGETVIPRGGSVPAAGGGVSIVQQISITVAGTDLATKQEVRDAAARGARQGADMAKAEITREINSGGQMARVVGRR